MSSPVRFRGVGTRPDHEPRQPATVARAVETRARQGAPHAGRLVASRCWCDTKRVDVTLDEVRAGQTRSCGRPGCDAGLLTGEVHA